jgi:hypothetical protein
MEDERVYQEKAACHVDYLQVDINRLTCRLFALQGRTAH